MKRIKYGVVIVMCLSVLLSIFGCQRIKDKYILDGPGMVNVPKWEEFTLSQLHSNANYCYDFTVTSSDDDNYFVSGSCRDDEGNLYEVEDGIPLTMETVAYLQGLNLEELETEKQNEEIDEDLIILDATELSLQLKFNDTLYVSKAISEDLALKIFETLSPYLIDN